MFNKSRSKFIRPMSIGNTIKANAIQFFDNYQPGLIDGDYTISLTSNLDNVPNFQATDLPIISQDFTVQGPRFTLPPEDIHTMSPAQSSTGDFNTELPHIVFNPRTLPWERRISSDDNLCPWLALLVFRPDELIAPPPPKDNSIPTTGNHTFTYTDTVINLLATPDVVLPDIQSNKLTTNEQNLIAQVIQISPITFQGIMPHLTELPYLAHCRQVNTSAANFSDESGTGFFSIIMANRFPNYVINPDNTTDDQPYIVHLVSLEGFKKYLMPDATFNYDKVQLFSLANWTFTCSPNPKVQENFTALMSAIVTEQSTASNHGTLQLPCNSINSDNPEEQLIKDKFNIGCVPLVYHTRQAETTPAWYHGPLTPVPISPWPLNTFAQFTAYSLKENGYDARYGVFDMTYLTAWELGRALALADAGFLQNLSAFRKQQNDTINQTISVLQVLQDVNAQSGNPLTLPSDPVSALVQMLPTDIINPMQPLLFTQSPVQFFKPSLKARYGRKKTQLVKAREQSLQSFQDDAVLILPRTISDWLKDLYLLLKIPFSYLVANEQLLPPESIRFFYLDTNWLNTSLAGALSCGIHTTHDQILNGAILQSFNTAMSNDPSSLPIAGFLLRSIVVSAWPGLLIQCNNDPSTQFIIKQISLGSNVLLCLLNKVPQSIQICEPHQQLKLGVELDTNNERVLNLRHLDQDCLGQPFSMPNKVPLITFFRSSPVQNVLNIASEQNDLITHLKELLLQNTLNAQLTASQWAIELLKAPLQASFERNAQPENYYIHEH